MTTQGKRRQLFDPQIMRRALLESFRKLDPRHQIRNPVMFVVAVGSVLTTILLCQALFGKGEAPVWFILAISLWLWFTVLFANFAEAMAERRGKAQAESLRSSRREMNAKKLSKPESGDQYLSVASSIVPASALTRGNVVPGRGWRFYPLRRRSHSRNCLGERKCHHRRKRSRYSRERRSQRRDRRNTCPVGLVGHTGHGQPRRDISGPDDCDGRGGQAPKDAQ